MAIIADLDLPSPALIPEPARPKRALLIAAIASALVVGVVGTLAVELVRRPPPPVTHLVLLDWTAGATAEYAATSSGHGRFSGLDRGTTRTVQEPAVVVVTVQAEPGHHAGCTIMVDGTVVAVRIAALDGVATCAWTS